jgi:hypothetical protein
MVNGCQTQPLTDERRTNPTRVRKRRRRGFFQGGELLLNDFFLLELLGLSVEGDGRGFGDCPATRTKGGAGGLVTFREVVRVPTRGAAAH